MEDVAVLDRVSKFYKGFKLDRISFSLKKGFIHGLIGRNGAGKTTTIKLMMDLVRPDEGSIRIFGLDNRRHGKEIRRRIGFVYAENPFYDDLTAENMKRVVASFYKDWDEGAFRRYLKLFDLPANKKIKHLSKGMKMKFSIALALSHHADFIIMDEPTSGLDPVVRREILELLSEVIQDENKTVLFSTHITSDLEQVADTVTFIHDGKSGFRFRRMKCWKGTPWSRAERTCWIRTRGSRLSGSGKRRSVLKACPTIRNGFTRCSGIG